MLVLIFPGQGSQRPGMGAPWRDHPCWALVPQLSEAAGRDLAELLLDADAGTLRETRNAQVATYAVSLLALEAARGGPLSDVPREQLTAVAGHSLGEYTALVAAGALGPGPGARLVRARGEAMHAAAVANPGVMAAVIGLELGDVEAVCSGADGAWVANDNTPGQVVVAGTPGGLDAAGAAALARGAKRVIPLQVGGAFHSPLMRPAQGPLDAALAEADLAPANCPVVANFDAEPHVSGFRTTLSAQLCARVRWRESLLTLARLGARLFVELGPGTELSGMVRRTLPAAARVNVGGPQDLDRLSQAVREAAEDAPATQP